VEAVLLASGEIHWAWNVLLLLTVPALVALNGLFVAAEFALVAVRRTRVEQLVKEKARGARDVENAVENLDRSIAATQLGITLASIGLGFVGEPALVRLIDPLLHQLPESLRLMTGHTLAFTIAFLSITFLHVVFGELIPKTVALQIPERTALLIARPLKIFTWFTRPFIRAMNGTGNLFLGLAGFKRASAETMVHSVKELLLLIEDTEEAGLIDPDQADLVENIFELSSRRVRECMVPSDRMAALELTTPPEQVLAFVRQGAHTRLPVYEGELDNIVGIVNTKDLFYLFSLQGVVVLQDALYPALFLKPAETIGNALRLFKRSRRHMAVVRDEAGHVQGLITLEDVLEEIVGDIEDEHDRPTPRLTRSELRRVAPRAAQKLEARPTERNNGTGTHSERKEAPDGR
jgi:magnesium and cobalt exporter, CNNM family